METFKLQGIRSSPQPHYWLATYQRRGWPWFNSSSCSFQLIVFPLWRRRLRRRPHPPSQRWSCSSWPWFHCWYCTNWWICRSCSRLQYQSTHATSFFQPWLRCRCSSSSPDRLWYSWCIRLQRWKHSILISRVQMLLFITTVGDRISQGRLQLAFLCPSHSLSLPLVSANCLLNNIKNVFLSIKKESIISPLVYPDDSFPNSSKAIFVNVLCILSKGSML